MFVDVGVQVGLLIGKLEVSSSRDSVFALVPTPAKDGEEAAKITGGQKESSASGKKSNAKAKSTGDNNSSLVIDTDWIAEHSRQVSRMLVGGMDVVGIFVFASETAMKNSTAVLWQVNAQYSTGWLFIAFFFVRCSLNAPAPVIDVTIMHARLNRSPISWKSFWIG